MMKNIYALFICLLSQVLILDTSFSQTAPAIEWQNTIGGIFGDELYTIQQTSEGGYILGGSSLSNISGDKTEASNGLGDYWIVKIDPMGAIQWQNTIGGANNDWLYSIQQTSDNGYILGGTSDSYISGDKNENSVGLVDYWIVKTNSIGNIQWQNTIGGDLNDYLRFIEQISDGGYILGGDSKSWASGDKTEICYGGHDYWIVKTDSSGNLQWQNTIAANANDELHSIHQTSDGGYIIGGWSLSSISADKTENCIGDEDYWIVKTDSSGNIQWQNTIGGSSIDWLYSIEQTSDGGYILGGTSYSNISGDKTEISNGFDDYWIVKTDSLGNIQWQNTIGGNEQDDLRSIHQTTDGGYILGGYSTSNISGDKTENSVGGWDYWILKLDSTGNIAWQKAFGGNHSDWLYSIKQTSDGGYVLGGSSDSDISGDKTENCLGQLDYWIIKLAPDTITGISNLQSSTFNIQFSPNPLTSQSTLSFSNPQKNTFHFTLYDITGRQCGDSPLERDKGCVITTDNKIILEKGNKQAGIYLFNLTNEKTGERVNGKIVISD